MQRIKRKLTAALTAVLATTEAINNSENAGGVVFIPGDSSITSLAFYAAPTRTGTFLPLQEEVGDGTTWPCSRTVEAGKCYELPAAIYPAQFLKVVTNASDDVDFVFTS